MQAIQVTGGWFVRLDRGEEVLGTLKAFVRDKQLPAGAVNAIGALRDVTLAYFEPEAREYHNRTFAGDYELLSLVGNISHLDGEPVVHLHCSLGAPDFGVIGGHFVCGTVAVTGEVFIHAFAQRMPRKPDPGLGINLLDL